MFITSPLDGRAKNFLVSAFVVRLNGTDAGGAHCRDLQWSIKQLATKGQLKPAGQGLPDVVEMSVPGGGITLWMMGEGLLGLEDTFGLLG